MDNLSRKIWTSHSGKSALTTLSCDIYANAAKINAVIRNAFAMVQLPEYTAHSFRKTLVQEMSDRELPLDAQKAWSQNLGHENIVTTLSAYLPVSTQRQGELIKGQVNAACAHKPQSLSSDKSPN